MKGFTHIQAEEIGIKCFKAGTGISNACAPPAPTRRSAAFCSPPRSGPAQLRLRSCSIPLITNCQFLTRGPKTKGQGSRKCDHCVVTTCACQNFPPGLCLACVPPAFPIGLFLPSHLLSLLISINSKTLSSRGLISPATPLLHPLARHLLEFLLPLPNSAIDFETFRNHPP